MEGSKHLRKLLTILAPAIFVLFGLIITTYDSTRIAAPMPDLDGDEAKQYLEQNNLGKSLGDAIEAARYSVNLVDPTTAQVQSGMLEAKNPKQNFTAYFSHKGVELVSREEGEQWSVSLQLQSVGRGSELFAIGNKQWTANKTRVSASHQIRSESQDLNLNIVE